MFFSSSFWFLHVPYSRHCFGQKFVPRSRYNLYFFQGAVRLINECMYVTLLGRLDFRSLMKRGLKGTPTSLLAFHVVIVSAHHLMRKLKT